jgi:hypothetical protein
VAGGKKGGRVYARDNRGRFASTGTARSRPAPKQAATRGTNRLTRNNSGQIVGIGRNGATARGGRLRTAAGNQRATQTARLARMGGTIAKPKGLKPGTLTATAKAKPATPRGPATSRLRPGELMNAVARPVGTMARPRRGENPFVNGPAFNGQPTTKDSASRLANVKTAKAYVESLGYKTAVYSGAKHVPARYNESKGIVEINRAALHWQNPRSSARGERKTGHWSSSSAVGTLQHEMGHSKSKGVGASWMTASRGGTYEQKLEKGARSRRIAGRVSRYAQTNPSEFIAETYAGIKTGRRYDFQVMRAYREAMGLSPTPAARRRSRVRRAKP